MISPVVKADCPSTRRLILANEQRMKDDPPPADACQTMDEVRAGVDATDAALLDLLVRRFAYMRAAARIKPDRESVRDEARKAEVVEAVRSMAQERGLPATALGAIWGDLVEASIAYELTEWERLKG